MDLDFTNRVALVVGGTGFIGSAVADRLRAEGATVVVASRHAGDGDDAGRVALDASDEDSVRSAIAGVLERHGRIDALVVSAAPPAQTLDPARSSDPEQILNAVDGKALAFLRVAVAAIPSMREAGFGRIVVISGQNAYFTGSITASVRNASTILIAKNLADELAGTGVTVNVVNPGLVTTTPGAEVVPGRGGESSPEQIADLIAFLSSSRSVVSGESISISHRVLGSTLL